MFCHSPPIPVPLPTLTSWKSQDELNQLTNISFTLTPIRNPLYSDEQTDATKSSNNCLEEELANDQNKYQRKYKKRVETEFSNSLRKDRCANLSVQSLIHDSSPGIEDSTTLDFDLTGRSRNYPEFSSILPTSKKGSDQNMYGQSDVDFLLTSEPVVSRQLFLDAINADKRSYNGVSHKPKNSR